MGASRSGRVRARPATSALGLAVAVVHYMPAGSPRIAGGNRIPMTAPAAALAPAPVPGGHLVLVDVHLAGRILGEDRGVVGADDVERMQVFTTS